MMAAYFASEKPSYALNIFNPLASPFPTISSMKAYRTFDEAVEKIRLIHKDYSSEAYHFLHDAMDYSSSQLCNKEKKGHLSAEELYLGCCDYAIHEYGPLAPEVLAHWGIHKSSDIGNIVYNLIEIRVFAKQKSDSKNEFDNLPTLEYLLSIPFIITPENEKEQGNESKSKSKS